MPTKGATTAAKMSPLRADLEQTKRDLDAGEHDSRQWRNSCHPRVGTDSGGKSSLAFVRLR